MIAPMQPGTPSNRNISPNMNRPAGFQRSFVLGCGLAVVWLVLLFGSQLLEQWAGVVHYHSDPGPSGGQRAALIGGAAFFVLFGLSLLADRRLRNARAAGALLLGWVAMLVLLCAAVLLLFKYGGAGIVPVGAG
jgi:hypothetical protein